MPGVLAVHVQPCGDRRAIAECARCGHLRVIRRRGLCFSCIKRCQRDGTLGEYGWLKADRLAVYREARAKGLTVEAAADKASVTKRTGWRYEAALREAGASCA